MDLQVLLAEVDRNRNLLAERYHPTPEQIQNFDDYFRIRNTFTSNALEGNFLSLVDTRLVLKDGISVGGKRINDLLETLSHGKTFDLMLSIARNSTLDSIAKHFLLIICDLHHSFYEMIDKKNAGVYRDVDVMIGGASILPPAPDELDMFMDNFKAVFGRYKNTYHPVCLAAYAHLRFVQIHPFLDGNGRTSRLLMNLILVNQGYQIVDIDKDSGARYYDALEKADKQGYKENEFYSLIAELELKAQKEFMRINHIDYPGPDPPSPAPGHCNGMMMK
ncbi:MAG: Fic family protein [Deltaproteobacteria bacterium]|jgi:Fic family protein|nr:Fic family protein [Deltaproteobacteria bacterium]